MSNLSFPRFNDYSRIAQVLLVLLSGMLFWRQTITNTQYVEQHVLLQKLFENSALYRQYYL